MPPCVLLASGIAYSSRLASARRKFQETVNKLVGGDEGEGLGEELQEAVETVQNVLDKDLVRCTA